MAYETTTVPVEKSQAEIRKLLAGHGAARFAFGEETDEGGVAWAAVTFVHGGYAVRIRVPHKPVDEQKIAGLARRARTKRADDFRAELAEREARRIWRVMAWNLKARLVAVEEGVETFAEAFLAHLLNPETGRTVYEDLADDGHVALPAPLRALPAGGAA